MSKLYCEECKGLGHIICINEWPESFQVHPCAVCEGVGLSICEENSKKLHDPNEVIVL